MVTSFSFSRNSFCKTKSYSLRNVEHLTCHRIQNIEQNNTNRSAVTLQHFHLTENSQAKTKPWETPNLFLFWGSMLWLSTYTSAKPAGREFQRKKHYWTLKNTSNHVV